ncbi:MAG: methylenetetrahydrofolate reductase [NAD(P)H] [Bacteroidales bacterium]|jgi:methylenetetrahydrofolate reductase (NADPH)|nr:methylenetetrahydrofolate reductase [NAD(P)H] [Bacteroidales bacterium]MDD4087319.1 methylenetetrahydrofolate reductase [NAD(P)H] [Bacteroidales bacterium]
MLELPGLTSQIAKSDKTLFSFEILPPLKGQHFEHIQQAVEPLMDFEPAFVNVTYHQEEFEYKQLQNGLLEKKTVRKRPGTVGIAAALMYRYHANVVPHIICGGFTREETENALIDLHFLGVKNLLIVRGDPQPSVKYFQAEPGGHAHAIDLVKQVQNLNQGKYLEDDLQNSTPTNFCMGVAGYPEKHIESPNLESDLQHLKAKIDAGASYIVTQMFFDNQKYFNFVDSCRAAGINVPVIAGLKPVSVLSHLQKLPQTFHIDLPETLVKEIKKCKDNKAVRQLGVEWTIAQAKELIAKNTPVLHFYTMGKSDNIRKIAEAVF